MTSSPAEDDFDSAPCYRHPAEQTALRCLTCDRPICVDCAIAAPVGFKCPDHGRTSRAERGVVPTARLARGIAAASATALVLGVLLSIVRIPFLGLIMAWAAGMAVGEACRRASGGYRDPLLARIAAACAAVGMLILPAAWLLGGASPGQWIAWTLLGAAAAAYGAYTRAS
jgi:hypothetical protein